MTDLKITGANGAEAKPDLFKYTSVQRISKIPVVESGYNYVFGIYTRVKNSNSLLRWSLVNVEGGIQLAVDKTMPTVLLLDLPLTMVDSIICKGLDTVSVAVPAINYPPEQLVTLGKDYVNSNLITPVLQRADSVKQMGYNEASRVGEMAASRLDNALNIADKYVDRYLPDSTDLAIESKNDEKQKSESRTSLAINHMNRLGKKLQKRLTKRTLMEAEALKRGGQDIAQTLIYLADLLLRDPKGFSDKMKDVWMKLSEDEPENQVPPANLEQLAVLIARESARRVVHVVNFVVSTLPAKSAHAFRYTAHHVNMYTNYFLKVAHLEGARGLAFATSTQRLAQLRAFTLNLLEVLGSRIKDTKSKVNLPLMPIEAAEINSNSQTQNQEADSTDLSTTQPPVSENDQIPSKGSKKAKGKAARKQSKDSSQTQNSTSSAEQPSSELDESSGSSTLEASLTVSPPHKSPS